MSLLEVEGLTHSFGENLLYRDSSLALNKGEHIGVVGQNGSGKSTLVKILTGQVIPDAGRVAWQPHVSVGYLDQYAEIDRHLTIEEFLKSAFLPLYDKERRMMQLYEKMSGGDADVKLLNQAAMYQEQLESSGFYRIDTRIQQVANGLGLLAIGLDRPIAEMSGGQRAKVILSKLLLEQPDVLLLDEPTNFLDKEHIAWLSEYLAGLENAFFIVSHDYAFLDKVANRICDIENKSIDKYYGTYSEFLSKKTLLREDYIRQYSAQQKEIKKTEEFIRRNIAGRKSRMARGRQKQLDRLERMEALEQKEIKPCFRFPELPMTNTEHLLVKQLSVGYHYPVLSDINFSIMGGQKVVITGFNGIGKSTLLKTLIGQIPAMGGRCQFSEQVTAGYFEQDLAWPDGTRTPIQIVADAYPQMVTKDVRKQLARCGVSGKHAMQAIGTLSGGEQAKVKLCLLTLTPCNFLILDEPTNHLDIQAKEALKEALSEFSGTVLLVSHEEAFYWGWTQKIINVEK
ncbi:MAG: ABC-F family ATP-binding cassette domain-containing protein [Hungatella hathewayi]|uniref:ABC-F family ATP-binding cassette domain-containing protein n=1 Tax=Hungatella TaxID=1649459 RepID=UPI0011DD8EA7|nr:ABC-F family ATP-binding cassette domain-containing protein [Hungatella hathewayi]MDU4975087.1 ABC-F family ATP-binding cassette domain-containing protein [Hungatella hathewayi]